MSRITKLCSLIVTAVILFCLLSYPSVLAETPKETPIDNKAAFVTGDVVNFRSSPDTSNDKNIISKLTENTQVTVIASLTLADGSLWYKIEHNGSTGYMSADYVSIIKIVKPEGDFAAQLATFPESYREALTVLHSMYPNWKFIADEVNIDFADAVYNETLNHRKLVSMNDGKSWRAMGSNYNWQTGVWSTYSGNWTDASREVIAYYMDPRNFLTIVDIFMFMQQSYVETNILDGDTNLDGKISGVDIVNIQKHIVGIKQLENDNIIAADTNKDGKISGVDIVNIQKHIVGISLLGSSQTAEGIKEFVKDTYLAKPYTDSEHPKGDGSYADVIMEAAKQSKVNPYVLASTLILEQGVNGTSNLISGKSQYGAGYYNFFNYKASGSNVEKNGIEYAKEQGWSSVSKSIIGGAKKYGSGYINAGQDTYYYKDFDILDDTHYNHQYAQSIYDAKSSASRLRAIYIDKPNVSLTFRIPVYKNMYKAAPTQPIENDLLNNYYFTKIEASGLSPTFSMYTQSYTLRVADNATVKIAVPSTASYTGKTSYSLKKGKNTVVLTVKSQSDYENSYTLTVTAEKDCTLTITK